MRIIDLRRPERVSKPPGSQGEESGGSGRVYRNRWEVKGHWHKYWIGPRGNQRLEELYVLDYEKGPEGAPLIARVNVLRK